MTWYLLLKVALKSILKNKMRSFLTSLGIIIGVCSVIVMVAIGQGSSQQIQKNIASLGTNMIMVSNNFRMMGGVSKGAGNMDKLSFEDVAYLKKNAQNIGLLSSYVRASGQIINSTSNWSSQIEGVDPSYFTIRKMEMERGKEFTEKDVRSKRKVCILGQTVVSQLFPSSNPVGQKIRIDRTPFKVIGVLKSKGENSFGQDQDDIVIMPSTTALYRIKGGTNINQIYISAVSEDKISDCQTEVEQLLREAHKLKDADDNDFRIMSQEEINEMATSTANTMTILLAAIAGVSLFVGGIGIMNIMLVSVTERTREIGIRLSVGARARDILLQFLTEGCVLSLTGGLIGIGSAFAIIFVCNKYFNVPAVASWSNVLLAFGVAGMIGVFFSFYPAKKAAELHPIDALRYE